MILSLLFAQFFGQHIHVPMGHHQNVDHHIDQVEVHYSKFIFFDVQNPIDDDHHTESAEINVSPNGLIKKVLTTLDSLAFLIILSVLFISILSFQSSRFGVQTNNFVKTASNYFHPPLRAPPR